MQQVKKDPAMTLESFTKRWTDKEQRIPLGLDKEAYLAGLQQAADELRLLGPGLLMAYLAHQGLRQAFAGILATIRSQDCRATAEPIYLVRERVRLIGFTDEYSDENIWITPDGENELTPEEAQEWVAHGRDPEEEGYSLMGVVYDKRPVQSFFTMAGAEAYIKNEGHRHTGPLEVYVDSGHRNREWKAVRALLLALAQACDVVLPSKTADEPVAITCEEYLQALLRDDELKKADPARK